MDTSSQPAEVYKYSPLPTPDSIRLLRVDSRARSDDPDYPQVSCTLKTVDLNDKPGYHALSYTWGNPLPYDNDYFRDKYGPEVFAQYDWRARRKISVDGKSLYVSGNLFDMLCSVPKNAWAKRCNRSLKGKEGRALLHWACMAAKKESVLSYLAGGKDLDIDAVDDFGRTGLSYAAWVGALDVVKLLIEAGADAQIVDVDGKKAVDYARDTGQWGIAEYLEDLNERTDNIYKAKGIPCIPIPDGPQVWAWIDQICINQDDLEERASQVFIMDRIYQEASYTLTYFGAEDQYTQRALQTILRLHSAPGDFRNSEIIPYKDDGQEVYAKADIPYISPEDWTALASLFVRQYFRRLWVVQEIVLSDIIVPYCGQHYFPWDALHTVAQLVYFRQLKYGHITSTKYINLRDAVVGIESQLVSLIQWQTRLIDGDRAAVPKKFSLESLVFDTWTVRAADPRDKIFGVYGLLNRTGETRWRPDYRKTVEEVYADATKSMIRESGDLLMLSAAIDLTSRNIPGLPSWVPDYSVTFPRMMSAIFNAAGSLPKSPIRPTPWNILGVSGVKIDTVLQKGNTTEGPGDLHMIFDPRWLELTLLLPATYHDGQTRTEALWRTICGNQGNDQSAPAPVGCGLTFRNAVSIMVCVLAKQEAVRAATNPKLPPNLDVALAHVRDVWSGTLSSLTREELELEFSDPETNLSGPQHQVLTYHLLKLLCLASTESTSYTPTLEQIEECNRTKDWRSYEESGEISLPDDVLDFYRAVRNSYGKRRLFVTAKRYIGLGPASMREGDEIWLLPGSGAVFVLRQQEDSSFRMVGEAYVHGVMNGEAAEGVADELRDIELV